ncbi:MAG TPA: TIM44-like domain-containing protein [Verrucomicrobiae bacterium]|nr:TIM44-like domain-containing protein [Verrucomicrobiae bacterium]
MIEILDLVARAGGGGSSGGGGGGVGIVVLPLILFSIVASRWVRKKRIKKARSKQKAALAKDPTWSEEVIQQTAGNIFYAFQKDWSDFNTDSMKAYLTPRYHYHTSLMLNALWHMNRRNEMRDVNLKSVTLFDVHDNADDELDRFTVEIRASATDNLLDMATGKLLHGTFPAFEELWHFEREGKTWMLDSVTQINRDSLIVKYDPVIDKKYADFAKANKFFYNADFGWLLMPLHGILFSDASYGRSDLNHHVIGLYHNLIVQFFEYTPLIQKQAQLKDHFRHLYQPRNPMANYTVAHTTLPKSYGNILVARHKSSAFFKFSPQGMHKITLEWPQFNKLFDVYATDMDRIASLELVHPAFMEQLVGLSFKVSIEVIGTDLYLYSTDKSADYQQMLDILKKAFKEMKL